MGSNEEILWGEMREKVLMVSRMVDGDVSERGMLICCAGCCWLLFLV